MLWRDFEAAAPGLAASGRDRIERIGLALLGTMRRDGFPRISPVEANFGAGHLLIGAMSRSMKAQDLRREPRCVLHNAVSDPDGADGEFKVYSTAHMVRDQVIRDAVPGAWWVGRPAADANVYSLHVAAAALVEWDLSRGEMIVTRWDARRGITMQRRAYP